MTNEELTEVEYSSKGIDYLLPLLEECCAITKRDIQNVYYHYTDFYRGLYLDLYYPVESQVCPLKMLSEPNSPDVIEAKKCRKQAFDAVDVIIEQGYPIPFFIPRLSELEKLYADPPLSDSIELRICIIVLTHWYFQSIKSFESRSGLANFTRTTS